MLSVLLVMLPHAQVAIFTTKGMLPTRVVIQHPFCIDAIQTFAPQPAQMMEFFLPREEPRVLHLPLLNLRKFLSAHCC